MTSAPIDFADAARRVRERRRRLREDRFWARLAALPPSRQEPYLRMLEAVFSEQPAPSAERISLIGEDQGHE